MTMNKKIGEERRITPARDGTRGVTGLVGLVGGLLLFFTLLALPVPGGMTPVAYRMAAVTLLMALFWITEAIPLPVTALLPIPLFPLLEIMKTSEVTPHYANYLIFLFVGGFLLASSIQKWNLHRRIALSIIYFVGAAPGRLVMGFMASTALLAMWISNTATAMMIFPVGVAVVEQLARDGRYRGESGPEAEEVIRKEFGSMVMLAIAYSASMGGIATLIGTPPNIVFAGFVRQQLGDVAGEVGFTRWMQLGLPITVLFLVVAYFVVTRLSSSLSLKEIDLGRNRGREVIREQLEKLGPMGRGERTVSLIFASTVLLWVFRKPIVLDSFTLPGWSSLLESSHAAYLNDATVAMAMALLLFLVPVHWKKREFALDWKRASRDMPWGILLLFGGGFAVAAGFRESGLDVWIGERLISLSHIPSFLMVVLVALVVTFLTELTSNTATASMIMPVLAAAAGAMEIHPFILLIPATISASCAFMLPVATPPNAIVFGSGYLSIGRMARTGLVLNLVGIILVSLLSYFLTGVIFM